MIKANMKRLAISATIVLGAALATVGPATAQFQPDRQILYRYTYYSDANWSEVVGFREDLCYYTGSSNDFGTATPYFSKEAWAYCTDGWLSPYDG